MKILQGLGAVFTLVSVVAFFSESRIPSSIEHWGNAVLMIGLPVLVTAVATVGLVLQERLERIETALRESRRP